ncbi:MAG: hypothetical protein VX874_25020 [Pseudomonadota bacterium]|nr:hypothetical protein [Pseudomonadota bacterium]
MYAGRRPIPLIGVSGSHVIILGTVLAAIGLTFDVVTSAALLIALTIHELGVVLGHRLAGHAAVRFRLIPMPRSGPVSENPHQSDLEHFFVTLMGPALGLAPMVLAFALSDLFAGTAMQHMFGTLALTLGAFNFIALLPIWPLSGGTLVQLMMRPGFPRVSALPAAAFFAGLIGLSWATETPSLFLTSVIGALAYAIRPPIPKERQPMPGRALMMAIPAYLATLSAFFLGGWWVLLVITGQL